MILLKVKVKVLYAMASNCNQAAYSIKRAGTLFIQDEIRQNNSSVICIGDHAFRVQFGRNQHE